MEKENAGIPSEEKPENQFNESSPSSPDTVISESKEIIENTAKKDEKKKGFKSKLIWSVVFVAIAALTIWAVTSQKDFSLTDLKTVLLPTSPLPPIL